MPCLLLNFTLEQFLLLYLLLGFVIVSQVGPTAKMMVVPLSLSQDFVPWALSRRLEVSLTFDKSHLMLGAEVAAMLTLYPSSLFLLRTDEAIEMTHLAFLNY
jgi:hypothetical protein